jgi:CheY-like chemotaxis protein
MVIEVADEGCGMDEQTRAHIFEPFFTTKPVGKGTGLGLSTVYGIVHQFGGRVDVDSTVGAGTRFTLRFPVADCGVPAAVAVTSSTSAPVAGTRLTILLVDDEASLCLAIAEFLRETGHHVLDSQNPSDALELARHSKAPIDLLLTDIVMPGLRGTELAEEVRKLHPGIQVMFMSGYAEGLPELAIPAGATFLQKPFRFSSLRERLTLVKRKE